MAEIETADIKNALIATAEILRAQMIYLRNLHENVIALYEALAVDHPELEKNRQASLATIRFSPEGDAHLRNIDSIIQWLKDKS
jgi:hypothetical protein